IRNLRIAICGVAASAFAFSYWFGQVDFILMFFAVTGALWMASGPIITLGLYWKRGTTAGAFAALVLGAGTAVAAIFAQKLWVPRLYPWIAAHGWAPGLDRLLRALSAPFEPWVHWELTPDKFPVNSVEVGVLTQLFTLLLYVGVSLATCRRPFNMDRLLHRGAYADERERAREAARVPLLQRVLGIDGNYTRGDKALAWSVFLWSFGWSFCACFLGNVVWHAVSPQPPSWWGRYFFVTNIVVPCVVGVVSTVWFGVCSTRDLLRLFRDLDEREKAGGGLNALDDGRVEGHVSLADAAEVARAESAAPPPDNPAPSPT
ncbi:MAG: sodium:panthothenate symporter, partial [Kiritimatiellae bacterium]|nr:sodium:panthothenate symporter [Kiritimatiellia bacterium]